MDRDAMGKIVRKVWVNRCLLKPGGLDRNYPTWENLTEFERETDRQIAEAVLSAAFENGEAITLDQYQRQANDTAIYLGQGMSLGLAYVALGLTGEAGEIANKIKKILRDDNLSLTQDRCNELKKELGDLMWYCAQLATELGASLGDVASDNICKLRDRKDRDKLQGEGDER